MRRWLLILLIALLPLRAWAGSAMVMSMPSLPGTAAHCADHPAAADISGLADTSALSDNGQQVHDLCDVCNGPAMTAGHPLGPAAAPLPQGLAVPERTAFISALPQRGHKPPIA